MPRVKRGVQAHARHKKVLKQAKATLPFNDRRDLDEVKKGRIAEMRQHFFKAPGAGSEPLR